MFSNEKRKIKQIQMIVDSEDYLHFLTDLRAEVLPVDTCPKNSTTEVTLISMTHLTQFIIWIPRRYSVQQLKATLQFHIIKEMECSIKESGF